ncbi:MAG TPA: hypothetical protein VHE80_03240 [Acidimicrobiales bacterium]|nr:hypothetical protein [Acidimicrobiales bacterium]
MEISISGVPPLVEVDNSGQAWVVIRFAPTPDVLWAELFFEGDDWQEQHGMEIRFETFRAPVEPGGVEELLTRLDRRVAETNQRRAEVARYHQELKRETEQAVQRWWAGR